MFNVATSSNHTELTENFFNIQSQEFEKLPGYYLTINSHALKGVEVSRPSQDSILSFLPDRCSSATKPISQRHTAQTCAATSKLTSQRDAWELRASSGRLDSMHTLYTQEERPPGFPEACMPQLRATPKDTMYSERRGMDTYPEALDVKIEIEGLNDHRSSFPQGKATGWAKLLSTYRPRSKPCVTMKPPI